MLENDYGSYEDKKYNCELDISQKENGSQVILIDRELNICYHWIIEKGELKYFELEQNFYQQFPD